MKFKIGILFLLIPFIGLAQEFKLFKPDVEKLKSELKKVDYSHGVVYVYLSENYKAISEKKEVINYDYPDYSICSFKQDFEHGIVYYEEQCMEAEGTTVNMILPLTSKDDIISWVESIFESTSMGIEHGWDFEKTEFSPLDKGVGCYYKLKESKNVIEIDIYCGC